MRRLIIMLCAFPLFLVGLSAAAFAGDTPSPSSTGTPSQQTVSPSATPTETVTCQPGDDRCGHHHFRFRQQDIDLNIGTGQANGFVDATGPLQVTGGTTQSVNPFLDIVSDGQGNSFNLHHEGLVGGQIDLRTCSITVDENDLPWIIFRGTGLFRNAIGFGSYTLRGLFSFPTVRGQCPELQNITIDPNRDVSEQLQADNLQPSFFDVAVQATGVSTVFRRHHLPCNHANQVPGVVRAGVLTG